ncbi:MAG: DUF2513 domain-containing protein [Clostridiales bacterium]|nr:DUF2513 domain-containing protein [Clostridiales bacterium]
MKLDMDCVRDVLLCVEENTDYHTHCAFADTSFDVEALLGRESAALPTYHSDLLRKYGNGKLLYHVRYCVEAGLLVQQREPSMVSYGIEICDLTVSGHELLGNIRPSANWSKAKTGIQKAGGAGLEVVKAIAEAVASAAVKQALGFT